MKDQTVLDDKHPMDCTDIKAMLSALVDDEVQPGARHAAERHLAACVDCRAMLDEAEAIDQLVAMDAAVSARDALPRGFEDAVLNQTVRTGGGRGAGQRWINWTGWMAAAAALMLAASIWMLDRGGLRANSGIDRPVALGPGTADNADDDREVEPFDTVVFGAPADAYENIVIRPAAMRSAPPRWPGEQWDNSPAPSRDRPNLDQTSLDTLSSAAMVMKMLSDAHTIDDLQFIAEVATYDDLPARLKDVREQIPPSLRTAVFSAEALLFRITSSPITAEDVASLSATADELELARQFNAWAPNNDASRQL